MLAKKQKKIIILFLVYAEKFSLQRNGNWEKKFEDKWSLNAKQNYKRTWNWDFNLKKKNYWRFLKNSK